MATVGIVDRVATLPVVQSTYGKVSEVYVSAKERSSLVNLALNAVEASVQVVASSAQPIVQTLEKPIAHADAFACRQFDYLEEKVPAIQSTPEEVLEGTKKFVSDTVTNNPVSRLVSSRLDHVLTLTEGAVDYILPEVPPSTSTDDSEKSVVDPPLYEEDDDDEVVELPPTTMARLASISTKVTDRTRALAIRQVSCAQRRAEEALVQLRDNMELITRAQQELKIQRERLLRMVDERQTLIRTQVTTNGQRVLTAVQERAENIRTGVSSAQASVLATIPASVHLPGGVTIHLDVLFERMSELTASTQASIQTIATVVRHLPQHLHRPIEMALEQARSLNTIVLQVVRGDPMTTSMLEKATALITALSTSVTNLGTFVRERLSLSPSAAGKKEADVDMDSEDDSEEEKTTSRSSSDSRISTSSKVTEGDDDEDDGSTDI